MDGDVDPMLEGTHLLDAIVCPGRCVGKVGRAIREKGRQVAVVKGFG